jgi:hypothetical protein
LRVGTFFGHLLRVVAPKILPWRHTVRWPADAFTPAARCGSGQGLGRCRAGPSHQFGACGDRALRVIHSSSVTRRCQPRIEQLFYNPHHGEQSSVSSGVASEPGNASLLGPADGSGARAVARTDPGVTACQRRQLGCSGYLRCSGDLHPGSSVGAIDRGLVCRPLSKQAPKWRAASISARATTL